MADEKTMTPDQLVAAYSAPAVSVNYMSASIVGEQMRIAFGETVQGSAPLFVRTRSGFVARPVQVGSRSSGMVAIVGGLAAGTPIATTNAFLLKAEIEKEAAE